MKKLAAVFTAAVLSMTMIACGSGEKKAEPIVGQWQLTSVMATAEGSDPVELDKETNQSFYAASEGTLTFSEDGTGVHTMIDGGDTAEDEITWVKKGNTYTVNDRGVETVYTYHADTDTLSYQFENAGEYKVAEFIFSRVK